jgi:hypothetical protein
MCSYFVLDNLPNLSYIITQIGSDEGRARGVRSEGNRHGPAAGLASLGAQEADLGSRPSWSA